MDTPMVNGVWYGYEGTFATAEQQEEHRARVAREIAEEAVWRETLQRARNELERLWRAAHPNTPFPYDAFGYDW